MKLCLTSQREWTGVHTAQPDELCILPAGHNGDHDFVPKPLVAEAVTIRYELTGPPTVDPYLDPPAWVSNGYRRPEAAA